MSGRLGRFALVALVPTVVDVVLLVVLRQGAGWVLVLADLTAIAVASVLSYLLHRSITFRSDPYVRWVRTPGAFVVVAAIAGLVDVVVLRGLYAVHGFDTAGGLTVAKLVSLAAAAMVRLVLYRAVLLRVVRRSLQHRHARPSPAGLLRASIVVPALQEGAGISGTVQAIRGELADIAGDGGLEIVVVDDGSTDDTADAALAGGADQVVVLPANRGKGAAVRAGVAAARGRTIAFTDADLAYAPEHLRRIITTVEEGWDVAVGSRRHPDSTTGGGAGAVRDLGSRSVNLLASAVLLSHPHDTQCGLKGFRADVGHEIFSIGRVDRFAFDLELFHLVERYELSVAEVPVHLERRERSTVHLALDTARLLRDLWRIRHWSATGVYEVPAEATSLVPTG